MDSLPSQSHPEIVLCLLDLLAQDIQTHPEQFSFLKFWVSLPSSVRQDVHGYSFLQRKELRVSDVGQPTLATQEAKVANLESKPQALKF